MENPMINNDKANLEEIRFNYRRGRMSFRDMEWLIVTLDYYLKQTERAVVVPKEEEGAFICLN